MRKFLQTSFAAMVLSIVGFGTMAAQGNVAEEIKAANQKMMDCVAAQDADACSVLYTKDGTLMAPNTNPFEGHAGIKEGWMGTFATGAGALNLMTDEVEVFGETAHEVGRFVLNGKDGSHMDHGKYIVIWKHEGGSWKLHRDIFNSNMAPR